MNIAWHSLALGGSGKDSEKLRDSEMNRDPLAVRNICGAARMKARKRGGEKGGQGNGCRIQISRESLANHPDSVEFLYLRFGESRMWPT